MAYNKENPESNVGKTFGDLTILDYVRSDNHNSVIFLCECSCGTICTVKSGVFNLTVRKNCGCKSRPSLGPGEAASRRAFSNIKSSAMHRNYSFNLTLEEFKIISQQQCHYCGCDPYQFNSRAPKEIFSYNGLDRVDNTKGYKVDNVVPCCGRCNRAKDTMTKEEFYKLIKNIYKRIEQ